MPPCKANGIEIATFSEEFSDYLEKLSCASGNFLIVGDFKIDFFMFLSMSIINLLTFWILSILFNML